MAEISSHMFESSRGSMHYLAAGSASDKLMIWVHGWPEGALVWKSQLLHFSKLGFYCVAIDLIGYGKSVAPKDSVVHYSMENITKDLTELLSHLGREKAIWVCHDWGCGVVWTLAGNFPQYCEAVISSCIPYGILERGLSTALKYVNRDIYPEDKYPYGPLGYMVRYQTHFDEEVKWHDDNRANMLKLLWRPADKEQYLKPSRTANVHETGWFGGNPLPEIPFEGCLLDRETHDEMLADLNKNGFYGADAFYANHERNSEYNDPAKLPNGGVLSFPVLYMDAKYDAICSNAATDDWEQVQRANCKDLSRVELECAHWMAQEKPKEYNDTIEKWLVEKAFVSQRSTL